MKRRERSNEEMRKGKQRGRGGMGSSGVEEDREAAR
jgi:hypothetical protein